MNKQHVIINQLYLLVDGIHVLLIRKEVMKMLIIFKCNDMLLGQKLDSLVIL